MLCFILSNSSLKKEILKTTNPAQRLGFAAGALSSIASSVWQGGNTTETGFFKENNWAYGSRITQHQGLLAGMNRTVGTLATAAISGGAASALTGGNFWKGATTGLFVSGLNHALHKSFNFDGKSDADKQEDLYYHKSEKVLSQKEFYEFVTKNVEEYKTYAENLKTAGTLIGSIPTDLAGWKDYFKDVIVNGNFKNLIKLISVTTFVGTHIYLTGDEYQRFTNMLNRIQTNYLKLHGNISGQGVKVINERVSAPAFGGAGVGSNIFTFYDVKTNKYLGGYNN